MVNLVDGFLVLRGGGVGEEQCFEHGFEIWLINLDLVRWSRGPLG